MTTGDLLVRVAGFPRSLGSPSLSFILPGSSSGDLEAVVEFLDLLISGRGKSAQLSSLTLVQTLSCKDKFSHSSVAHHGVDHALEFFG